MAVSLDNEGRRGIFGWIKGLFGYRPETYWEDKIQSIVYKLKEQQHKLEELSFRMEERAKELFERTVEHLKKASMKDLREDERRAHYSLARTFAEEIYEIRRFLKAIKFTSISLEKAAMRLQTVRDIKDFREVLVPVSNLLNGVKDEIAGIFPSIGQALDEINRSIAELVLHASAGVQTIPSGPLKVDEDVNKILSEAWAAASESVEKNIPEPSKILGIEGQKEPFATKSAESTGAEATPVDVNLVIESKPARVKAKEAVALPSSLAYASLSKVEELVLAEIKINKGVINVEELSRKYNVPREKVLEALQSLTRKGRIKVKAGNVK
uniref:Uncharacterized protein n=1 Tax=Fervidicoccus fontis TaxID=683846 RepID=A0A7J3ZLN2_9CREN